jgi:hypothetical protein
MRVALENEAMIDLESETMLPLGEAARNFPGGERHISTVHRYRLHGIAGIRLECLRLGGRWFTSKESMRRFLARLNASSGSDTGKSDRATAGCVPDYEKGLDEARI